MTFYSMLVSLTRIFLPFHERYLRQAGHVHYNEIMLAMLYWYSVRVCCLVVLFQDAVMVSKQTRLGEMSYLIETHVWAGTKKKILCHRNSRKRGKTEMI